jgi:hypothetical protein
MLEDLKEKFPDAEVFELTDLIRTEEVGKGPWRLYIYGRDGYHSGGIWFTTGGILYPDEEISFVHAKLLAEKAVQDKKEVRVCDGNDWLVFHSEAGKVVYGATFWNEANPDPAVVKVAERLKGKSDGK